MRKLARGLIGVGELGGPGSCLGVKWSSLRARWGWRGTELGPPREPWLGGREWGRGGAAQWRGGAGRSRRRGGAWAWGMGCGRAGTRAARAKWRSEGARRGLGARAGEAGRRRRGWRGALRARLRRVGVAERQGSSGTATLRGRGDDGGVACGRQVHGRPVWALRRRGGASPCACRSVRVNGLGVSGARGVRTRERGEGVSGARPGSGQRAGAGSGSARQRAHARRA